MGTKLQIQANRLQIGYVIDLDGEPVTVHAAWPIAGRDYVDVFFTDGTAHRFPADQRITVEQVTPATDDEFDGL